MDKARKSKRPLIPREFETAVHFHCVLSALHCRDFFAPVPQFQDPSPEMKRN